MNKTLGSVVWNFGLRKSTIKKFCCDFGINYVNQFSDFEKELLNEFMNDLGAFENPILVGHSIKGFDMPFIAKRSVINGVEVHKCLDNGTKKPWELTALDVADLWKNAGWSNATLSCMCYAMGIETPKNIISGGDVHKTFWGTAKNRIQKIVDYCERDVVATAQLFFKMEGKGELLPVKKQLKDATNNDVIEIKKSITEDLDVSFNVTKHQYLYKDKILTGATTILKPLFPVFDGELVAKGLEKSWGVDKKDILKN